MILLTGASGTLGKEVARELKRQNREFKCLVRESSNAEALEQIGAPLVYGDVRDRASLEAAMAGVDAVISTHTLGMPKKGVTHWDVDYRGNLNLIELLSAAGGRKFVYISGLGAKIESSFGLYKVKQLIEDELRISGLDYTVLRPSGFFTDFTMSLKTVKKYHLYPAMGGLDHKIQGIHQGDLAFCAVDAVTNKKASRQVIPIGGPEVLTAREVSELYSRLLGCKVRPVPIPGALPRTAGLLVDTFTRYRYNIGGIVEAFSRDSVCDNSQLLGIFDIRLRPLEEYLREVLGQPTP